MADYCKVECSTGRLVCSLPITAQTGKVRVLRRDQPVATRSIELCEGDIVEWQISYFAFAGDHRKLVELAELLELAYHNDLIETQKLQRLLSEIRRNEEFFEERYSISIDASRLPENFHGFRVLKKIVPILQKNIKHVQIWVELRPRQRAVGFQPMLYLRIPIELVSPNLVGRTAERNQIVTWEPSLPILLDTVRAFSIASQKHHQDMIEALERILRPR